jgi:hypothetical protein
MRDHPAHGTAILGGMWGAKKGTVPDMKNMIEFYVKGNFWQVDQNFLREIIYPKILNNSFVHDSFFTFETEKYIFPTERKNKEFVGDVFDEYNNRHPEHFKFL